MTFYDSLATAGFIMAVVFMVLVSLWGLIALFSAVLRRVDTKFIKKANKT